MATRRDRILVAGALALGLVLSSTARAADTEPGTWWEQTVEMEMAGMSMPPQKQKVCLPKTGISEPPSPNKDDRCKVTDVKNVGNKMSWKMKCTGPEPMTGEGEITHGKDGFDGTMSMHSSQGDMKVKMWGKPLGGDCDAGALKKQVAAVQKQQQESQQQFQQGLDQQCDKAAEEMQLRMFTGNSPFACKKPEQVAKLCARLATREGYLAYKEQARGDAEAPRNVQKACGKDPEAVRPELCAKAAKDAKKKAPTEALSFLSSSCPDEARTLAKAECAGRDFTGTPEWRGICVQYAKDELRKGGDATPAKGESEEEAPKKDPKEQAVDKAKNVLKGLFGK